MGAALFVCASPELTISAGLTDLEGVIVWVAAGISAGVAGNSIELEILGAFGESVISSAAITKLGTKLGANSSLIIVSKMKL